MDEANNRVVKGASNKQLMVFRTNSMFTVLECPDGKVFLSIGSGSPMGDGNATDIFNDIYILGR